LWRTPAMSWAGDSRDYDEACIPRSLRCHGCPPAAPASSRSWAGSPRVTFVSSSPCSWSQRPLHRGHARTFDLTLVTFFIRGATSRRHEKRISPRCSAASTACHRTKASISPRQLCAGLAATHDCGVLHRDLTPASILLDGRGCWKTGAGLTVSGRGPDNGRHVASHLANSSLPSSLSARRLANNFRKSFPSVSRILP
jgi:serine/threonine protein kinase